MPRRPGLVGRIIASFSRGPKPPQLRLLRLRMAERAVEFASRAARVTVLLGLNPLRVRPQESLDRGMYGPVQVIGEAVTLLAIPASARRSTRSWTHWTTVVIPDPLVREST